MLHKIKFQIIFTMCHYKREQKKKQQNKQKNKKQVAQFKRHITRWKL